MNRPMTQEELTRSLISISSGVVGACLHFYLLKTDRNKPTVNGIYLTITYNASLHMITELNRHRVSRQAWGILSMALYAISYTIQHLPLLLLLPLSAASTVMQCAKHTDGLEPCLEASFDETELESYRPALLTANTASLINLHTFSALAFIFVTVIAGQGLTDLAIKARERFPHQLRFLSCLGDRDERERQPQQRP